MPEPMLEMVGVTAGYGRSMVLFDVDLSVPKGGGAARDGPQRRRQDDAAARRRRPDPGESGKVLLDGEDVTGTRPNRGSATASATSRRASSASRR